MNYDFIEIGTSDFDTLIESCDEDAIGLSIEPIKYYIDRLPNKKNVKKLQYAISDVDGLAHIYYVSNEKIQEYNLPNWVRGSNSVNRPHPFVVQEIGKELYDSIVTIQEIPSLCWNTLVQQENIDTIEYLKIDTEGFDHIILNDYLLACANNPNLYANKIKFENHKAVSNTEEIEKIILNFKDYYVQRDGTDVILTKVKIPRIIHQTFSTNELPTPIQEVVDGLKKLNPEFEYRFYNDEDCIDFIRENYDSDTVDLYLSINPIYGSCRADFFRYLLMYKVGGVYLDIKSSVEKPLKEIILSTDEFILTHWEGQDWKEILNYEHGEFQNWHIICVKEHPFLKKTIELVKEKIRAYQGGAGKTAVIHLTLLPYSKAILSLLAKHKTYKNDSPIREFKLAEEVSLTYMKTQIHHSNIYGTNVSLEEPIVVSNKKHKKAYVLYANTKYLEILTTCVKSIRAFSDLPILVYLLDNDTKLDIENVVTINWQSEFSFSKDAYKLTDKNFYIDRRSKSIYELLIQRPLVVKHALEHYANVVAYVDSDSVATKYCDRIFDLYNDNSNYPYFVESIYDFLIVTNNGINIRGGAVGKDFSTTVEAAACELFGVDQSVRKKYRQTGYFVAGINAIEFLEEWYWMCIHPKILKDFEYYAAYHEETIANVLLWKRKLFNGLPYIYTNASLDKIDLIYNEIGFGGQVVTIAEWFKLPAKKEDLLFFHGEKRIDIMEEMITKLENI